MKLNELLLNQGYQAVKLAQMVGSGHLQFTAELNGVEACFILDTGAGYTVLEEHTKDKFGLTLEETEEVATGAGGTNLKMQFSRGNHLVFGDLEIENFTICLLYTSPSPRDS